MNTLHTHQLWCWPLWLSGFGVENLDSVCLLDLRYTAMSVSPEIINNEFAYERALFLRSRFCNDLSVNLLCSRPNVCACPLHDVCNNVSVIFEQFSPCVQISFLLSSGVQRPIFMFFVHLSFRLWSDVLFR